MRIQESVNSWGNLLIATGGALQPAKCFYSIILFEWINGGWQYALNDTNTELGVSVPFPGGGTAGIGHKLVTHIEKTLGAMTSPDGDSRAAIMMMQDKAQQWVNDVRNSKLHCRNVWFSLKFQLLPRIMYSLCSSTATFEELGNALRKQYYQILPFRGGGLNHHHRESDNRFGFLWDRAASLGGRGTGGNVKQATYALWMGYCNGAFHVGKPLTVSVGIGDILTASTRILRKIQFSLDTLLDENAMGEDLYVRHQNDCCRRGIIPPTGGRPLPDADVFREGLPAGDAPPTELGTDILAGVIRIRHPDSDSIRHQDRLRGPRPAPEMSQEITTAVANRTPDNI